MGHHLLSSASWGMPINQSTDSVARQLETFSNLNSITPMRRLSCSNRTIARARIFLTLLMLSSHRILHGKRRTSGLNQVQVHHSLVMLPSPNMMKLSLLKMRSARCSATELQNQEILRFSIAPTRNLVFLKKSSCGQHFPTKSLAALGSTNAKR